MAHVFSVYQAKARLSELLRLVQARREVIITQRGRVIARIVPAGEPHEESLDQRFDRFRSLGLVKDAARAPKTLAASRGPSKRGALDRFLRDRS